MQIISDTQQTSDLCQIWRDKGDSVSFVPTMGCLHAGHLSLIEKAKSLADHVVVSIFVNPLQFDNSDDLMKYPSTLEDDVQKLKELNVDLVFTPTIESFYPEGKNEVKQIDVGEISSLLEGEKRPGHFAGVATVVKRLFEIISPNFAVFGEKDFQQLMVIQQLVDLFCLDVKIIAMPTFRERDGLAMSSRNVRLSEIQREKAAEIYRQLKRIKSAIEAKSENYNDLEKAASESLRKIGFIPDYVVIRETSTLLAPENQDSSLIVLIAARIGEIRLIDNIRV